MSSGVTASLAPAVGATTVVVGVAAVAKPGTAINDDLRPPEPDGGK